MLTGQQKGQTASKKPALVIPKGSCLGDLAHLDSRKEGLNNN